jgi:hypothetical protein
MVKAKSGNVLILGLSDRNLELLKEGNPIVFPLSQIMPDADPKTKVMIMNDRTEIDIINKLKQVDFGKLSETVMPHPNSN